MKKIMTIFVIVTFLVLISTTVIFAQAFNINNIQHDNIIRYESVEIKRGDCLSLIAHEYNTSTLSTKEFTKYLKKFNNLKTDTIYYGNNILVPIFK